jgi:hypothetical protein
MDKPLFGTYSTFTHCKHATVAAFLQLYCTLIGQGMDGSYAIVLKVV